MAQRNPKANVVSAVQAARMELERLAAEKGVQPITDFESLRAHFWPEEESVDDFLQTVRERRRASERRSIK
jgi:phage terminase small subunit